MYHAQAVGPQANLLHSMTLVVLLQNATEQTVSHSSASVWSANSLFMPAALQVPALMQQQHAQEGMREGQKFSGLPSAAAMILPEALAPNDPTPSGSVSHLTRTGLVDKVCFSSLVYVCRKDESVDQAHCTCTLSCRMCRRKALEHATLMSLQPPF